MANKKSIERIIRITRPSAKFVNVSHSSDFTEPIEIPGKGYFYVNLYDEKIDAVLGKIKDGSIYLIHNTYLSSFAYNLYLSWIHESLNSASKELQNTVESPLIKHNFKKFYAEQLFHFHNNIFSRAILLETLLYEQQLMIPVFGKVKDNAEMNQQAKFSADLMSSIVSFHELGHLFRDVSPMIWDEMLAEHKDTLGRLFDSIKHKYNELFLEEFICDTISVFSCISQYKAETDICTLLKSIIFGFSSFTVMMSLTKSAEATAENHKKIKDIVDFRSIENIHRDYDYRLGKDIDFIERAKLIIELCKLIAKENNCNLFDQNKGFSLSETILQDLTNIIDRVMDTNDDNARQISMLVAEAFHNHPKGIEYLYLRSKEFKSNRELQI